MLTRVKKINYEVTIAIINNKYIKSLQNRKDEFIYNEEQSEAMADCIANYEVEWTVMDVADMPVNPLTYSTAFSWFLLVSWSSLKS